MDTDDADVQGTSPDRPSPGAANANGPTSSYNDWGAVQASLEDAMANPPRHLEGESSFVYDWPDEPIAGAMLVSDPLRDSDDDVQPSIDVVLLLNVVEDGPALGISLNADSPPNWNASVPIGLEDVPLRCGGDHEIETVIGVYPTPDGKEDEPRINMDGLSYVVGARDILHKVQWGHVDKDKLRLYTGVRYWPPGGLEAEITSERWLLVMATKNFVFDIPPNSVYYRLMEKLGCV